MLNFRLLLAPTRHETPDPLTVALGAGVVIAGYLEIAHRVWCELALYSAGFDWRAFWMFIGLGGVLVFGVGV